jgi:hypothetical protein
MPSMTDNKELPSVTVSTSDTAVMYCLRSLHMWAARTVGVSLPDTRGVFVRWSPENRTVTLSFSTEEAEQLFLAKAQALLPAGSWSWTKLPE